MSFSLENGHFCVFSKPDVLLNKTFYIEVLLFRKWPIQVLLYMLLNETWHVDKQGVLRTCNFTVCGCVPKGQA